MNTVALLVVKGLAGGALVVAFALLGEALEPKRFAGIFAAAPSVALSSLTIVVLTKGYGQARANALGMIVGAVAFLAFTLVVRRLVSRFDASGGSALACIVWLAVAGAGYEVFLR
jgi:uncharacterized membrane protein (GlpM family)